MITRPYVIDQWTERGVKSDTRNTKREANLLAEHMRTDKTTLFTIITRPSGSVRICNNPKRAQK